MKPGVVTNCWKALLDQGAAIGDLVRKARDMDFPVIELRQGCLGTAETDSMLARPDQLAELAEECPKVDFDYAMSFPFLSEEANFQDPALLLGQQAALATAGQFSSHLRIVDVTTTGPAQENSPNLDGLIQLANNCQQQGMRLSLEHSRQPWDLFYGTVSQVRQALQEDNYPTICFDPANFSLAGEQHLSASLLGSLDLSEISMVHIKQFRDGRFLESLEAGAVDWRQHRSLLEDRGYEGPLHLEISSSTDIWQRLDESLSYWEDCSRERPGG
jgi:sugar phosphate isomerase/epimerase